MNLPDSIRQWIYNQADDYPALQGVNVYADGESETASPPFIAVIENGSTRTMQDGVPIRGVNTITIAVELQTVPAGLGAVSAKLMENAMMNVVCNTDGMKDYIDGINATRVLDIFCDSPILTADDGRRVATVNLEILAHPI